MPAASRVVHYYVATSVDGFIARRDGSFDCFPTEGDHVAAYLASLGEFDTVLMGRKTYEVGLAFGVADPYPALKAFVYSRSEGFSPPPHPNVTLVRSGAVEHVRQLRAQEGGAIYLCGGAELAGQLLRAGLVDELTVKVNPIVLGEGVPLVAGLAGAADGGFTKLELVSPRTFESGVVFLRYRVVPAAAVG